MTADIRGSAPEKKPLRCDKCGMNINLWNGVIEEHGTVDLDGNTEVCPKSGDRW